MPSVSVVARGSWLPETSRGRGVGDDRQWTILDQNISIPPQKRRDPGIKFSTRRRLALSPRRPDGQACTSLTDLPALDNRSLAGWTRPVLCPPRQPLGAAESWKHPSNPPPQRAQEPSSPVRVELLQPAVVVLRVAGRSGRINTSWPPPTPAVPRRTSPPHHLQPRLNWTDVAIRANHHDTRI